MVRTSVSAPSSHLSCCCMFWFSSVNVVKWSTFILLLNSTQGHYCTTNAGRCSTDTRHYFHPFLFLFLETIINRVSPVASSPNLLATPNWPLGMRPSSTVSWIVTVPSQYEAHVHFVNLSQPKCKDRHTSITVKMLGDEEELMSRREDEQAEDTLRVPRSFYLNMSNCIPEERGFGAMTNIVLQKKSCKQAGLI